MKFLFPILLLTLLAGPAQAQSFEAGRSAARNGDYSAALGEWQPLAEQGDARAQYSVGVMYERGLGVDQDSARAMDWYQRAADQEYALAQYNFGALHQQGQGAAQNFAEALKWYKRAAEQGVDKAQYNLGYMYHQGQGAARDFALARKWYGIAAAQGYNLAQYNLAVMHAEGQGGPSIPAQRQRGTAVPPSKASRWLNTILGRYIIRVWASTRTTPKR